VTYAVSVSGGREGNKAVLVVGSSSGCAKARRCVLV